MGIGDQEEDIRVDPEQFRQVQRLGAGLTRGNRIGRDGKRLFELAALDESFRECTSSSRHVKDVPFRLHRLHRHWNVAMPGDENDWNAETRVVQLLLKVQAIDSGKVYIQNQATGSIQPRSA